MMTCKICSHPERAAIDQALVGQHQTIRDIATQYGVSRSAVDRHKKHIPKALVKAKQAETVAETTTLLSRVERLAGRCESIIGKAESAGKWAGAAAAARELRGCLELLAKLNGELQSNGARVAINIANIANLDISALSDEQLSDLYARLVKDLRGATDQEIEAELASVAYQAGFGSKTVSEAPLFDEVTVPPGPAGNQVCWNRYDGASLEEAKKLGHVSAKYEYPKPKWTPYRNASPSDRFLMLQAAWKRITGLDLPEDAPGPGALATIAIEFDLSDPREEHWYTWPKVRLVLPALNPPNAGEIEGAFIAAELP